MSSCSREAEGIFQMRKLVFTLAAMLLAGPAIAQDAQAPAGDVKNGEKHFMSDGCYECHGIGGNGASLTGPKLSRTALTYDQFVQQLRQPASEMAPYEAEIMPDKVAADIYAYLMAQPASPSAKDLPLLMGMGVK
jgi:ubiquinol-cytochrome c reductase cytochrome c subunit